MNLDRGSKKGPTLFFLQVFKLFYIPKRFLGPLLSYALEINLSTMVLQWPKFFNYAYTPVNLMLLPGNLR